MTCKDCIHFGICNCDVHFTVDGTTQMQNAVDVDVECKNFKDKSRYIETPCKVGDTVYIVDGTTDGIVEGKITRLEYNIYTTPREWITVKCNHPFFGKLEERNRIDLLLGKTVFLTKEEAEKALAESHKKYK